ncbi:MarR family winged helix-turn-helix transcriptional regulator [Methylobacterium nodulans]|uniref:Transcriptional regulator, MarR family n=1 Tax=Methylobacterium nodulans (strain LMG 21967 / CNCM I-2342 / ORS 2060) TaxID=460265 RepID=B8IL95_METNO|nr:MarR family transcriptional regulator [Methylobacterium nodulans]ACL60094.1 transcriptional regulator, MarR family [Methylobacterium nodulans ORS 2060]
MITLERKYAALLARAAADDAAPVEEMRLCFEVLALAAAIDRDCAARLGPHGLSEGKFVLLFLLEDAEDGLSPHELADRAGVTRGTVTGLLDGLERAGFVRRLSHDEDRRRLVVRLTPEGRRLAKDLIAEHGRWIGSLFSDLSGEERAVLSRLLARAFERTGTGAEADGRAEA